MCKYIIFFLAILFSTNKLYSQKKFINKEYGISIAKPKKWQVATNKDIFKNLENFDFSKESREKLLNDSQGQFLLTSFYKYNPETHSGLIPTIQINIRANHTTDFEIFKKSIIESTKVFKNYFTDFEFEKAPAIIEISGVKSVYFIGKFTIVKNDGTKRKVRSRTYAIPRDGYFFQVNFTDGQIKEDNSKLFDKLVKSIEVHN